MRLLNIFDIPQDAIIAKPVYTSSGSMLIKEGTKVTDKVVRALSNQEIYSVYITDKVTEQIKEEMNLDDDFDLKDVIDPQLRRQFNADLKSSIQAFKKVKGLSSYSAEGANLMRSIEEIANTIVSELLLRKDRNITMVDVKHLDIYDYEHAVSTAILSVVTGMSFGFSETELMNMAQGALLMNISNELIDNVVTNYGHVSKMDEKGIEKAHPELSQRLLSDNTLANAYIKNIVLKHHERMDGSGYPKGLNQDQVDKLTKIVMIADVYDEMTSDRPDRKAYSPNDALEYIMAASHLFDYQSAYAFSRYIIPYPPGDLVELNNGAIGLVIGSNELLPLRPVIRVLSGRMMNEIVDLKTQYNIVIKRRVTSVTS